MKTYVITFESPESISPALKNKIKSSFSFYCPIHTYAVAVKTEKSAKEIREIIKPHLPSGGRLFVIRSGVEAAWLNSYGEANNEWLKNHL